MGNFIELDFWSVESAKSGDAITIRYKLDGLVWVHVVDGGFQKTGETLVEKIKEYYEKPSMIDHVVATHPDGDHAGGLRTVLEEFQVGALWMLRPWVYADELLENFPTYSTVERLRSRLKSLYPNLLALEEIATRKKIPIHDPFQGAQIGMFTVASPTREHYLKCILESERTPENNLEESADSSIVTVAKKIVNFVKSLWGHEVFSTQETSAENEMSVVQYADIEGKKVLLTADAGREALSIAVSYLKNEGVKLPGVDWFQVPHHGSRRNVSTTLLDKILGEMLEPSSASNFFAIISSAKEDEHHPRKAVVRAMIHRGGRVYATEGSNLLFHHGDAPVRVNYSPATPADYPDSQETD